MFLVKVTYFLCLTLLITQCKSDCVTSVKSFKNILVVDQNNNIQYSNEKGNIVKKPGESITLACPGSNLKGSNEEKKQFTCTNKGYSPKLDGITCDTTLKSIERKKGICNNVYYSLEIGFQYKNGEFISQIDLCWDDGNKRTLWTSVKLQQQVNECPSDPDRPNWMTGPFFDKKLAEKYTQIEQRSTLNKMFNNHIPSKIGNNYLQKGHLVAKCDFVYEAQQRLTFHYINAAPQWDTFNTGNWKTLETQTRKYATAKKSDLDVYTGTFSILQIDGQQYYLDGDNKKVPVPNYFWKVIIKGNSGVAIVGSNDIFNTTSPICKDVLNQIKWLQLPKATDKKRGHMIACEVSEFMKITNLEHELPNFPAVTEVLK